MSEETQKTIEANEIAGVVIDQAEKAYGGDLFVVLGFRYGIADELWRLGYRKVAEAVVPEGSQA